MFKAQTLRRLPKSVRGSEWWGFKLTPLLGTIYATSILYEISLDKLFPFIFFSLAALIPGASYVSLLNDLTDLKEDKLAGKENRLEGKSRAYAFSLLFVCLAIGAAISFFLVNSALVFYLLAWIVFTLYSAPPFRLKKRGFLGVMADALGSHVFPQLFVVSALTEWYDKDIDIIWLTAVAVWSVFWGMRGILWHQLKDRENDQKTGVKTFVQRYDDSFVQKLVGRVIFPIEIFAFLFMLIYAQNSLALIFLLFNALLDLLRHFLWNVDIILVSSTDRYRVFMDDYYGVFYPVAFLITGLNSFFVSWLILLFHLILFFYRTYNLCFDITLLGRDSFIALRKFILGR